MIDTSSLSSWAEILSGAGSAIIAIWKFIIKPKKNRKRAEEQRIKNIEDRIKHLETESVHIEELIRDKVNAAQERNRFEIEELKKDYESLNKNLHDHILKVDAKNDKLLDLIIKYFTEKE